MALASITNSPATAGHKGEVRDVPAHGTYDVHRIMHQVNRTLDRAIDLGLMEHAERIVQSAMRAGLTTPQFVERVARLKLAQDDPEHALHAVNGCQGETNSLRMLRIVCQLLVGERFEAHLELRQWSRRNTCPLEARCLLALLDHAGGDSEGARNDLHQNVRQLDDPMSFELLILLAADQGKDDLAQAWAERLLRNVQSRSAVISPHLLVESLDMPLAAEIEFTRSDVESLASELVVNEPLLPALTTGQELEPERNIATLLYRAIEYALPELTRRDAAIESLVRLAVVLENRNAAIEWIRTAIEENRITPALARVAQRLLEADDAETGEPVERQPDDADVLASLHKAVQDAERSADADRSRRRAA
jgi:tetratricopeptide (TPR) repeat protein